MLNSDLSKFVDPVTAMMVGLGHRMGLVYVVLLPLEAQSRTSALYGQIHSREEYLGAESIKPRYSSTLTNQISRSPP